MARVGHLNITVYGEHINKEFKLALNFNQEHDFHVFLPDELNDSFKHIEDLNKYSARFHYKNRHETSAGKNWKAMVYGKTESECLASAKEILNYLAGASIKQRNVIIVFYKSDDTCKYNDHRYNNEHPQIGIKFGLTYAVETTLGEKKIYSQYREVDFPSGQKIDRKELSLWNSAATIIDDTDANREMLERIYTAFVGLREKLNKITETPQALLKFIESNGNLSLMENNPSHGL